MEAIFLRVAEAARWTLVFHRVPHNWFFSLIAMGHFKHVSAFAWLPDARVWLLYDVGFRRTRIVALPDTPESKALLTQIITGNAIVTMPVREDALPFWRPGLFCTTGVAHLIGLRSGALRPDALFRSCLRNGGQLSDDEDRSSSAGAHPAGGRPQPHG